MRNRWLGRGSNGMRSIRVLVAIASSATVVAGLLAGGASAAPASPRAHGLRWLAPHQALVRFRDGTSLSAMNAAHAAVGATPLQTFRSVSNLELVSLPSGITVQAAVARYAAMPQVRYAQPNFYYRVNKTPDDHFYPDMWNLDNTGQTGGTPDADIDAPEAWDIATGNLKIVVGGIDTGIDYTHPDLKGRIDANQAECNGTPGVDDDGNGYIDDCHGIDTYNHDSDPMDDFFHGTHTAGTMGAKGNNSQGVVGVNWKVTILACKSHNGNGLGTSASIIECFQYMDTMKDEGLHIVATNNSYGGCPEACGYDQATYDAIASNQHHGIIDVFSAGNDANNNDSNPVYPASYFLPNVISVAATDSLDNMAGFSNYGVENVDVGAPGVAVISTMLNGAYASESGTSMAGPHVAGLAALLAAHNHLLNWKQIRNLILAGGDFKPSLQGKTVTGLRLNAYGSLTCSNRRGFGIEQPLPASTGPTVTVAALDINCAHTAAHDLTVTITPGGDTIQVIDNGKGPDLAKKDGILTGEWTPTPCVSGTYTFTFPNGRSVQSLLTC